MQYLSGVFLLPSSTILLLCVICGLALLALRNFFYLPLTIILLYPFAVLSSLGAANAFILHDFYSPLAMDQWLLFMVLSATFGTAACLVAYLFLRATLGTLSTMRRMQPATRMAVRHIRFERD